MFLNLSSQVNISSFWTTIVRSYHRSYFTWLDTLHLMIIIYHHSYGTVLHLSLPAMCRYCWSLMMSRTVIVTNNHRSCLHLLQHSWMLLLLINLCSSSWSSSFCWKFCCRPRCIALRAILTVRHQLCILHRFLMPPSTEAGQTLPLVYIHSWSTFIVLLYCHLRTAPCSDCVLHCTVAMPSNRQRLRGTF